MKILWQCQPHRRCEIAFGVELKDYWIGLFIDPSPGRLRVFVCLVPCLPIRLTWSNVR